MEITFVAFPFLGKHFSFCARWPEGRLSPDVSRWFVSERASSLLAADPQPLLLIPTRSVRILRLNPFFSFSSHHWADLHCGLLIEKSLWLKEWSWDLKSGETVVPFWSYDTASVSAEGRKINKLPASLANSRICKQTKKNKQTKETVNVLSFLLINSVLSQQI